MTVLSSIRPSNLFRLLEDTTIVAGKAVGGKAKAAGAVVAEAAAQARHEFEIEQRAKAIVKARAQDEAAKIVALTPEQIEAMEMDIIAIHMRAAELQAAKAAKV